MHDPNCACCAGGRDIAAMLAREDADIERIGFHCCLVLPGDGEPGFVYTSGLAEKALPEFIFVGGCDVHAWGYIAGFVETALKGDPVPEGLVPAGDGNGPNPYTVPAWVVPADDKLDTHAIGVRSRLRRIGSNVAPRLLQVVMPDLSGRFPWEDGYRWREQLAQRPRALAH